MNRSIKNIVSTVGIVLALSGLDHGFFEVLQGNTPTPGIGIQAIGPHHQMWLYGSEGAISLIPNFLWSGLASITVSLIIILWSLFFLQKKHGATVFLLLFLTLFAVGGGFAQIIFFLPAWAVATRINSVIYWPKFLSENFRRWLAGIWQVTLSIAAASFLIGLAIAITGYVPGVDKENYGLILIICWTFVFGGGWFMFLLTYLAGFAFDAIARPVQK
ncbi:MAG: hypothetical protein LWX83_19270 [Anaerolineae bacterium]|nr:hypothetical protein [Anaerolineae bacterium]